MPRSRSTLSHKSEGHISTCRIVVDDVRYRKVTVTAIVGGMPESVNHMYTVNQYGKMVLKAAGRTFQDRIVQTVAPLCLTRDWRRATHKIYTLGGWVELDIVLCIEGLRNGAWVPKVLTTTKSGAVRSPYKKLDGTNYIKCIEDGLVRATGIDDSLSRRVGISKDFYWTGDPEVKIEYNVWLPLSS